MPDYDPAAIEAKWQHEWERTRLFEPKAEPGRPKFMIIFAYPGISGYLHVGHMRGYTYCDAIARHRRQLGENVLFPAGFHASGIPAVSFARKVERGDESTLAILRAEKTPEAAIAKMKDPAYVVEFFRDVYEKRYWRPFGFSIDYSRLACTTDEGYKRFIQWQFRRLHDRGLLVQKPHFAPFCPSSGPVAVDASETDVSRGGDAEVVAFTALKFRGSDGLVFPCATLRAETVFGATNVWVNPAVEYVIAQVGGEKWVLSPEARVKADLLFEGGAREVGGVSGRSLVGLRLKAPITGRDVPVFPSSFVDPKVGTGVVMSVPAHAPFDFQALQELRSKPEGADAMQVAEVQPITLISVGPAPEEGAPSPAAEAVKVHGVRSLADRAALEMATQEVYAKEFREGRLLEITGEFAGLPVAQAREKVAAAATASGDAVPYQEFSKDVICRCGQQVLIKRIPDQWFIRYSDPQLTQNAASHAKKMEVAPEEVARDLPKVLEWYADRACIRQGAWLGTPFPLDEKWVVEPISDSTLYPVFYLISQRINRKELKEADVSDQLLDFVFLGRGSAKAIPGVAAADAQAMRSDFLYWYPLDLNLGGKEHKTVHFPAFVKTHIALLAPEHWPRGIFVNWWVTMAAGNKVSKSKGGAEPVADLVSRFGVDALRLYYAHAAAPWLDVEWDPDGVLDYRARLARIHDAVKAAAAGDLLSLGAATGLPPLTTIDRWLSSARQRRLEEAREGWAALDFRQVAAPLFFGMLADLRWYLRRGGRNLQLVQAYALDWAVAMTPIAPHLGEELYHSLGGPGAASTARLAPSDHKARDHAAEFVEDFIQAALEDVQRIRQVAEGFQSENLVRQLVESLAGKTVRGELVGAAAPFKFPAGEVVRQGSAGEVDLIMAEKPRKLGIEVKSRASAAAEWLTKARRLIADGEITEAWLVVTSGVAPEVRADAKQMGVLISGPQELDLIAQEHNLSLPRVLPKRLTAITAPAWKVEAFKRVLADAAAHGRPEVGRVMKSLAADASFKAHIKGAAAEVPEMVQEVSSHSPAQLQQLQHSVPHFDEFHLLKESAAFLDAEIGCPVDVLGADDPKSGEERFRGKADQAAPMRPAIVIEY